jgi:hypothetical protein
VEIKVAGLLSNKLIRRVTLVGALAEILAVAPAVALVVILAVIPVAAPAVTLAWQAAKLAFSHVVLIPAATLAEVLVVVLAAALAATLVPIPVVPVAGRLGKLSMKPVQAGELLAAVLAAAPVPTHAKAHVAEPVVVRAAEPVLCTAVLPILIHATTLVWALVPGHVL